LLVSSSTHHLSSRVSTSESDGDVKKSNFLWLLRSSCERLSLTIGPSTSIQLGECLRNLSSWLEERRVVKTREHTYSKKNESKKNVRGYPSLRQQPFLGVVVRSSSHLSSNRICLCHHHHGNDEQRTANSQQPYKKELRPPCRAVPPVSLSHDVFSHCTALHILPSLFALLVSNTLRRCVSFAQ